MAYGILGASAEIPLYCFCFLFVRGFAQGTMVRERFDAVAVCGVQCANYSGLFGLGVCVAEHELHVCAALIEHAASLPL